jgi:hypothetical protein
MPCPLDTYSNVTRSTSSLVCKRCNNDQYSFEGSSECEDWCRSMKQVKGFVPAFNCSYLVPIKPSPSIQNAAFHSAVSMLSSQCELAGYDDPCAVWNSQLGFRVKCNSTQKLLTEISRTYSFIPPELMSQLFRFMPYMRSIDTIDLGDQQYNTTLPPDFRTLTSLRVLILSNNRWSHPHSSQTREDPSPWRKSTARF